MEIRTLWAKRRDSYPGEHAPELLVAWDEFSIDDYREGWEDAKASELAAMEGDLVASAELVIDVPDDAVFALFESPKVSAEVVS